MNQCLWVLLCFVGITLIVIYIVYLCNLHSRVSRLERKASPRLEIIEREVHGIGCYMRIIVGLAIFFCVCISIHYLCYCHPKFLGDDTPCPDAEGTVVTIFGTIIALLVGWQIFSNLKEREKIENLIRQNSELTKDFEKKYAKLEQCCNDRKEEIRKLIDATNNSFERIMTTTETYIADIYEDLMADFPYHDIEFRFLSHRIQALQNASSVGDIVGCNIIVSNIISRLQSIDDYKMKSQWKDELKKDLTEIKFADKIIGYNNLIQLIDNISTIP